MPDDENEQKGVRGPYKKADWRPFFLAELERTNCVKAALDKAQISRQTYERYKSKHPEFVQACRDAKDSAVDYVEAMVHQRCLHGDKLRKFDREGKAYFETVYPDSLIIRYLQAHRPESWHRAASDAKAQDSSDKMPGVIYLPKLEDAPQ